MNSEKARDFFSAYYEGSLEPGLVLKLEQQFSADPSLKSEYQGFASAFENLDAMRHIEVEVPIYLSDRIATRLEETRQQKAKPFGVGSFPWARAWVFGLAGLAIIGGGIGITMRGQGPGTAQFVPGLPGSKSPTAVPTFKFDGSNVLISYQSQGSHSVVIADGITGTALKTLSLDDSLEPKLDDNHPGAQLFSIREDNGPVQYVAVPGTTRDTTHPSAEGTLGQFAMALADFYHVPVLLENVKPETKVKWSLDGADANKAANANLQQVDLTADVRSDGMLSINGH